MAINVRVSTRRLSRKRLGGLPRLAQNLEKGFPAQMAQIAKHLHAEISSSMISGRAPAAGKWQPKKDGSAFKLGAALVGMLQQMSSSRSAAVGFLGRASRIARAHQYGTKRNRIPKRRILPLGKKGKPTLSRKLLLEVLEQIRAGTMNGVR